MIVLAVIFLILWLIFRHPALWIIAAACGVIGLVLLIAAVPGPVGGHYY